MTNQEQTKQEIVDELLDLLITESYAWETTLAWPANVRDLLRGYKLSKEDELTQPAEHMID